MARAGESVRWLCELGWHQPSADARWNAGYYFTQCRRCGQDLVRTAYGRWRVPRGYRVVWQTEPPSSALPPRMESAAPHAPPGRRRPAVQRELPIREVLRYLAAQKAQRRDTIELPATAPDGPEPAARTPLADPAGTSASTVIRVVRSSSATAATFEAHSGLASSAPPPLQPADIATIARSDEEAAPPAAPLAAAEPAIDREEEPRRSHALEEDEQTRADPFADPTTGLEEAPSAEQEPDGQPKPAEEPAFAVEREPETKPDFPTTAEPPEAPTLAAPQSADEALGPEGALPPQDWPRDEVLVPEDASSAGEAMTLDDAPSSTSTVPPPEEADERAVEQEGEVSSHPASPPQPRWSSPIPDFMDDEPAARWRKPADPFGRPEGRGRSEGSAVPEQPVAIVPLAGSEPEGSAASTTDEPDAAHIDDADSPPAPAGLSGSYRGRSEADEVPTPGRERFVMSSLFRARGDAGGPSGPTRWAKSRTLFRSPGELALAISLLVGLGLLLLAAVTLSALWEDDAPLASAGGGNGGEVLPSLAGTALPMGGGLPPTTERAFVAASLLNCRSAPARQADVVRRLERGDSIGIIATENSDWASVAHQGRQCWVASRYLAREEPL